MNFIRMAANAREKRRGSGRYCRPVPIFDCTEAAEFLYACVELAIDKDLPQEIDFLRRNDEAMRGIMNTIEMPDRMAEIWSGSSPSMKAS
jgi:hypothetical protein